MESSEPKTPPLVMVKVAPLSSWRPSLPSRAAVAKRLISDSIFANDMDSACCKHRHGQPALGADGDAEIHVVVIDQVVAIDEGVDARELAKGEHGGPGEEAHEAERHAVGFVELVLVLGPQGHHRRDIDFVDGGEDGGGLLGLHEPLGDPLADLGHGDALDALASKSPGGSICGSGSGGGMMLAIRDWLLK